MNTRQLLDTYRAHQFAASVELMQKMRGIQLPGDFESPQQALLEVRVDMETVNAASRSERIYGRGDIANGLLKLAATAAAMAAALRARDEADLLIAVSGGRTIVGLAEATPVKGKKSVAVV